MRARLASVVRQITMVLGKTLSRALGINRISLWFKEGFLLATLDEQTAISERGTKLAFVVPNSVMRYRVRTFSSKEPETLDWIDQLSEDDVLWDVGANVGLYSLYAAAKSSLPVFSFEPSVFNLELLVRNIANNNLAQRITIVPLALSRLTGPGVLSHSTLLWGGALSSFVRHRNTLSSGDLSNFPQPWLGFRGDDLVKNSFLPRPTAIKIDVDGEEGAVLEGLKDVLSTVQTVLIEVDRDIAGQAENIFTALTSAGLHLIDERSSPHFLRSTYESSCNQIWRRVR